MPRRPADAPARRASVLRISDAKTQQLVELYADEECLWNPDSAGYRDRDTRLMAAEKIATILDLPNFTARHVIMKFRNLRNSYSQELKKIAASEAQGDSTVYVPKVLWFETMDSFLRPYLQGGVPGLSGERQERTNEERQPPRGEWQSSESEGEGGAARGALADLHATFGQHVASLLRALPPARALALQPRLLALIVAELEATPQASGGLPAEDSAVKIEIDNSD